MNDQIGNAENKGVPHDMLVFVAGWFLGGLSLMLIKRLMEKRW